MPQAQNPSTITPFLRVLGTLIVIGAATFGAVTIASLTLNSNTTAPSFTATSTSGGGYRFGTNGNIDIGTPALSAGNAYASGTAFITNVSSTQATSTAFNATNLIATNDIFTNATSTNLSVTNASATKLIVDTTSTASTFVATKLGTAAQASYSFAGNPDTGLFEVSAGRLGIASGGSSPMSWTSQTILAGDVIVNSTNAYDLGSVTAGFKNIYVSSTIFGVNSTMTGTSTAGPYILADNAGMVTGMDMTITSALANGGDAGYQFNLNNDPYLDIYGRYDSGVIESTSTAIRLYHNLLGMGGIDIGTSTGMGAGGINNVYASGTLALGGTGATSTIDSMTATTTYGSCLALQDVTGGTRTYCTTQGGTLSCSTTSCK